MTENIWSTGAYMRFIFFYKELFVAIFYFIILYYFVLWRSTKIKDKTLKVYYMPAFIFKMIGAISTCLIYIFFYKHGDPTAYYNDACVFSNILVKDFRIWYELMFTEIDNYSFEARLTMRYIRYAVEGGEYPLVKFAGIISLFTFNSFLALAMVFSTISFLALWKLMLLLVKMFPYYKKEAVYSILFIPTVVFWGSGVMKEPIVLTGMSYLICGLYSMFVNKNVKGILTAALGFYLIFLIKIYVLLCLLPGLVLYIFIEWRKRISDPTLKFLTLPFFIIIAGVLISQAVVVIGSYNDKYTIENITKTAKITGDYIKFVSDRSGGSSYDLGEIDFTSPSSLIAILPKAVNVTLYRPYIWEVKNPVMLLSALESFIFLVMSLRLIFKTGIRTVIYRTVQEPFLLFCISFSIVFGLVVGATSLNFGTLVRYKVPLMPFFCFYLLVLSKGILVKQESKINKSPMVT